jgi:hypothetical protein
MSEVVREVAVETTKAAREKLGVALVQSKAHVVRHLVFTLEMGRGVTWFLLIKFPDDRARRLFAHRMGRHLIEDKPPAEVKLS